MAQRVRILIVDDQRPVRYGLRALLSLCPQLELVGEAADGLEAVRMVADRRPDVVLMDLQMPGMDGLQATRRIKELQPEVRVVALTMFEKREQEAVAAGADGFLLKGCSTEDLFDALTN